MLFKTLLFFMINTISIDRLNHINDLKWINRILVVKNDKKSDFHDPMCGAGTILTEAALIAHNIPPNIFRKKFGFQE